MVYLKSVENVITLGKLIGLLFLFCLSILFLKTKRNDFLVLLPIIRECGSTLCRVGMYCSTHQYKLPVNFSTNPTSGGFL